MVPDKVSIILVTLNSREIIKKSIKSILAQNYNNLELIIIDGASKDGTIDILKEFNTGITNWISAPDKGIYDAMNKGLAIASGKWILFLGADDTLCSGILNEVFLNNWYPSVELLYGKVRINNSSKTQGTETDYMQLISGNIPHQAIFYTKTILNRLEGYDLRYKILADYDLNLKIFEQDNIRKEFINKEIAIFCSTGISNRTIDYSFFSEKLSYFIVKHGLSKNDKRLAKYYFFVGVTLVLKKSYVNGFKNLLHPVMYGGRRIYYFILLCHFFLTLAGIGRKYKYVENNWPAS